MSFVQLRIAPSVTEQADASKEAGTPMGLHWRQLSRTERESIVASCLNFEHAP
jgi:hypothetical protein